MNINRHNYETFFLLYVDNELCAAERNALELFVKENTDLQEELNRLQQSIVQADDITFNFKNNLLKPEIISAATQQNLLLYIDGELDKNQQRAFELTMAADENIATELEVLQQTKLLPDTNIIFVDKQRLYRKEIKRITPFGWWRLAAAAIFIGFGIWGVVLYFNSSNKVLGNQTITKKENKPTQKIESNPATATVIETTIAATPVPIKIEKIIKKIVPTSLPIKQSTPVLQEGKLLVIEQKINNRPDNNLPKPYFENLNNNKRNKNDVAGVTQQMQKINSNIPTDKSIITIPASTDNNVYTAAFKESTDQNKEDRFTLTDDDSKKSKLGGFFRKAKRILARNTKMKTGDNNVKVANLEFAIQ